jgi:phospholipid/cholesterol/gamma-HCH transport system substrate-binding protein
MYRPAEHYDWEDTKGYFDIRIHPNEDRFYLIQLASSEKGFITRREQRKIYYDEQGYEIDMQTLDLPDWAKLLLRYRTKHEDFWRGVPFKIGLQFGKIFGNIAARFGLFENSVGIGVDFDIPFKNDYYRWVMSFEVFDFRGWNRQDDRRPHVKWINKMFFANNFYTVFGADDFVSQHNANIFAGVGIRFGDDDVKYLLPSVASFNH